MADGDLDKIKAFGVKVVHHGGKGEQSAMEIDEDLNIATETDFEEFIEGE